MVVHSLDCNRVVLGCGGILVVENSNEVGAVSAEKVVGEVVGEVGRQDLLGGNRAQH